MIKKNPIYFPSSKSIVVFGRNKLNGTDAIIPLLFELASISKVQIIFCVSNHKHSYKAIKENVVFRDLLNSCGSLNLLGGFSPYRSKKYLVWAFQLILIFFHGLVGGKVIHYGEMNNFPFTLLRIVYRKRVFLIENNTNETYYGPSIKKITRICTGRVMSKKKKNYLFNDNCKDDRIIYRKSTMEKYEKNSQYKFYYYGRSRSRPIWLDYLKNNHEKYLNNYHASIGDKKYIVIIGTAYDIFYNRIPEVFYKMLDIFENDFSNEHFLYKPHPLVDTGFVEAEIRKRNLNLQITYLHPNILAIKAKVFVGNNFSNMMTDAYLLDIPTIEFANYTSKMLAVTEGSSMSKSNNYVNYFINNDPHRFREILDQILKNSSKFEIDLSKVKHDEPSAKEVLNLLS